jgi:hypothetical protein
LNNEPTIAQSSSPAKAGRILRRRWQKAAGLNRWSQVIKIFDSGSAASLTDRDILWYIRACIRQKNLSSLNRACEFASQRHLQPNIAHVIARDLTLSGLSSSNCSTFNAFIESEQKSPLAIQALRRNDLADIDGERQLSREEASIKVEVISPGKIKKIPTEFSSTVSISGSARVPQEIFGVFRKMDRQLLRLVDRLEQPEIREFSNVFTNRFGQVWDQSGRVLKGPKYLSPPTQDGLTNVPRIKEAALVTSKTKGFFHWYVEKLQQ